MNYKDIEIFLHIIFPLNGKSYSYVKKDIYFYEIFDNGHSIGEFNNPFSDTRLNIHQEIVLPLLNSFLGSGFTTFVAFNVGNPFSHKQVFFSYGSPNS